MDRSFADRHTRTLQAWLEYETWMAARVKKLYDDGRKHERCALPRQEYGRRPPKSRKR